MWFGFKQLFIISFFFFYRKYIFFGFVWKCKFFLEELFIIVWSMRVNEVVKELFLKERNKVILEILIELDVLFDVGKRK